MFPLSLVQGAFAAGDTIRALATGEPPSTAIRRPPDAEQGLGRRAAVEIEGDVAADAAVGHGRGEQARQLKQAEAPFDHNDDEGIAAEADGAPVLPVVLLVGDADLAARIDQDRTDLHRILHARVVGEVLAVADEDALVVRVDDAGAGALVLRGELLAADDEETARREHLLLVALEEAAVDREDVVRAEEVADAIAQRLLLLCDAKPVAALREAPDVYLDAVIAELDHAVGEAGERLARLRRLAGGVEEGDVGLGGELGFLRRRHGERRQQPAENRGEQGRTEVSVEAGQFHCGVPAAKVRQTRDRVANLACKQASRNPAPAIDLPLGSP